MLPVASQALLGMRQSQRASITPLRLQTALRAEPHSGFELDWDASGRSRNRACTHISRQHHSPGVEPWPLLGLHGLKEAMPSVWCPAAGAGGRVWLCHSRPLAADPGTMPSACSLPSLENKKFKKFRKTCSMTGALHQGIFREKIGLLFGHFRIFVYMIASGVAVLLSLTDVGYFALGKEYRNPWVLMLVASPA